jgi:enoyl-CoA hydratase
VSDESVLVEVDEDGIALVTLNRPDSLNSANEDLHTAISAVWGDLANRPEVRCVVLRGAGRMFSAGGDLPLLQRMADDPGLREKVMGESSVLVHAMAHAPWPIVAAVHGAAVGLGCSLASLSDLVVMEEDSFFSDPHVQIGLVAGDGGALTWPFTAGLQRTKEWLLFGTKITAQEALQYGICNRVVPKGGALEEAMKLAKRLLKLPPQAMLETRKVINQPLVARIEEAADELLQIEIRSFDEPAFQSTLKKVLEKRGLKA